MPLSQWSGDSLGDSGMAISGIVDGGVWLRRQAACLTMVGVVDGGVGDRWQEDGSGGGLCR